MKIKFNWTNDVKYASLFSLVGGYIPENINPENWKGYIASSSGGFLAHDALAHQAGESGKTWEEARAIGATLYFFRDEYSPVPQMIINDSEKEGTWIAPPHFEESELSTKARENLSGMTQHLEEWVGWIVEGWKYAENSPYTREHYRTLKDIPFASLWRDNKEKSIVVDLETKTVEVLNG